MFYDYVNFISSRKSAIITLKPELHANAIKLDTHSNLTSKAVSKFTFLGQ
ncbi:hypothetical protein PALI_a2742 [Pseudoalteromonas aliena SW19]|uniref:Uncharacterized protein n=1 Tax=Pseudoalteromonas aliena SW19 TaxID=1314866 RepID=A0ABR9E286_9GAMM|nr:hypothetical protein [Pseudoalteromonas aliena SW19]